ncbi:MAG TPA: phage portal protein, partial [Anaerolineaceae bacterium]|nr:phage portal protein [Anaerolineaceae bacterium]
RTDTQELLSGSGIGINFLAGDQIIPISSRNGILKEAAFVSDQEVAGKKQQKVSVHLLENELYTITNLTLDESGKIIGEPVTVRTGSPVPWFSVIRKSGYNRHDAASVFGVSILDGNEDVLKGLDTAFDNFIVDFILGRKMVFMNSSLWSKDENGAFIAPQMMGTQLFINVGDKLKADQQSMLEEYNPQLRVAENAEGVQRMLDFFSFNVGLGRGFYKLNEESMITTATEYTGSRQTLVRNVAREMIGIEAALKQLMQALLWIGENVLHVPGVKADADVSVVSNDGYITDEYTERKVWQEEVAQGLRSKQEYRERFMGETEQEAIEAVAKIKAENPSLTEMLGEVEA